MATINLRFDTLSPNLTSDINTSQICNITFKYTINAQCDNVGTDGLDSNTTTTMLYLSTNSGSSKSLIAEVTASILGGNYPISQYDSQTLTGTTSVTIDAYHLTDVEFSYNYTCDYSRNGKSGSVNVEIISATVDNGYINVVCNNGFNSYCSNEYSTYCHTTTTTTLAPTTTTTTTLAPITTTTTTTLAPITTTTTTTESLTDILSIDGIIYLPNSSSSENAFCYFTIKYNSVIQTGFVWSTNNNPTINDNKYILKSRDYNQGQMVDLSGDINKLYGSSVTNLILNQKNYFRVFATTSTGTHYGSQYEYTPSIQNEYIHTGTITHNTNTSVDVDGDCYYNGIQEIGFVWSTNSNPTINDNKHIYNITGTTYRGYFTAILSPFNSGTKYYYNTYIITSTGVVYGNIKSFTNYFI